MRLQALDSLLEPILAACRPVPVERRMPADALGMVLASAVRTGQPVPLRAVALRDGFAMRAADLVGASPSSPVIVSAMPPLVRAGEALPSGCDCVLDPDLAVAVGPYVEIIESMAPGSHVRLPGHDLAAGEVFAPAGGQVDAAFVLACRIAGVSEVEVRVPRVAVSLSDADIAGWFEAMARRLGCRVVGADAPAALRFVDAAGAVPRLAIRPGEAGWIEARNGELVVEVPGRFDGALGVFCLTALPVLARLFGASLREKLLPLSGKVASAIGIRDLALLLMEDNVFVPLSVGDAPLRALIRASHFLAVPPEQEGVDAGAAVGAISLTSPFEFGPMPQE